MCWFFELFDVHIICVSLGVGLCNILFTILGLCFSFRNWVVLFLLNSQCSLEVIEIPLMVVEWRVVFVTTSVTLSYEFHDFLCFSSWFLEYTSFQ